MFQVKKNIYIFKQKLFITIILKIEQIFNPYLHFNNLKKCLCLNKHLY